METDGSWAQGGGLVVSVLAYYSNNLSSNPANVRIINCLQIAWKERKYKEQRVASLKHERSFFATLAYKHWSRIIITLGQDSRGAL